MHLDTFLAQSERRAFQIAYYATRNSDDALDIVQEAMMKLAQQYSDKPASEWPPLFHCILQSKIHDWYRKQKVRKKWFQWLPISSEETNENIIENAPETTNNRPDDKLEQSRAMNELDRAVKNLPLRQQQAFLLRSWEGLSVAETANAMKCSQGSVKTHFSRAIHNLREKLEGHV